MFEPEFKYDDGGRAAAGFKGRTGDCVTRAITIATELPYRDVYDTLFELSREWLATSRTRRAARQRTQSNGASPRSGMHTEVYKPYLKSLGWTWMPTMGIGTGCRVHLRPDELPSGRVIARLSGHDTYDCSRDGTRCVYGVYHKSVSVEQILRLGGEVEDNLIVLGTELRLQ
jgi:hypothetical protein